MYAPTPDLLTRLEILRDKPIGYWPLHTDTFAIDFHPGFPGALNPGTFNGTIVPAAGPFTGSRALAFDGSTSFISTATSQALTTFTLECWAYKTVAGSGSPIGQCNAAFSNATFYMRLGNNSGFQSGTAYREVVCADPPLNVWCHHVVTYDGANLRYVFNAVQNGTPLATTDTPLNGGDTVTIGRPGSFNGQYFPGNLAHVALYNYALSPARIAAHFNARRSRVLRRIDFAPRLLPLLKVNRGLDFEQDERQHVRRHGPRMIEFLKRQASFRGLYRIFNSPGYRFYRSTTGPPQSGDVPFATNATLPYQPATTFPDGTYYLSVSYFDGVLDSGFLPLGPHGETYTTMTISGGVQQSTPPSPPTLVNLQVLAGGVVRINAFYARLPDGTNAATTWAIAYTTDGSTPTPNSPTVTVTMPTGPVALLAFNLPAQVGGTVVKVLLQTRRGAGPFSYSVPGSVLVATALTTGPSDPLSLSSWPGSLPQDV